MSLYREQKTSINDPACLMTALKGMGFTPHRYTTPQQLIGYQGDKRKMTAEIVIPRAQVGAASNDIGFKRQADGTYMAIISDYDQRRYNDQWLTEVKTKAWEAKVNKLAVKELGLKPHGPSQVLPNGKIRVQFVKQG